MNEGKPGNFSFFVYSLYWRGLAKRNKNVVLAAGNDSRKNQGGPEERCIRFATKDGNLSLKRGMRFGKRVKTNVGPTEDL